MNENVITIIIDKNNDTLVKNCQNFGFLRSKYVKICQNFAFLRSKFVKICQNFAFLRSKFVKICQNLGFQVKFGQSLVSRSKICQNKSKFWLFKVKICQNMSKFWIYKVKIWVFRLNVIKIRSKYFKMLVLRSKLVKISAFQDQNLAKISFFKSKLLRM